MKKSYVVETSLVVKVDIDLGEITQLVETLEPVAEAESNNWRAVELLRKLKDVRREAMQEAEQQYRRMVERT